MILVKINNIKYKFFKINIKVMFYLSNFLMFWVIGVVEL